MSLKKEYLMNDESRIALLENNHGHICKSLDRIESGIIDIKKEITITRSELKYDIVNLDKKFEKLRENSWSQFRWILAAVGAPLYGAILTAIIHQFLVYIRLGTP